MKRVFVDSSYWIGLRNRQDRYHEQSKRVAQWIVQNRLLIVVTPLIFAETHAYFSRAVEIREMVIRDFWRNPIVTLEQPTYQDQLEALKILGQRDKSYSFADAMSFVVMTRIGVYDAISYDDHFQQFGRFRVIDGREL